MDDPRESAAEVPRLAAPSDPPDWDAWGRAANRHMLAHMMRRVATHAGPYPPSALPKLVAARNAWVADMREIQGPQGEVPVDIQQACWAEYVAHADAEISAAISEAA